MISCETENCTYNNGHGDCTQEDININENGVCMLKDEGGIRFTLTKDVTDFIADFGSYNEQQILNILKEKNIEIPNAWKPCHEGFMVIEDKGDTLVLGFYNIENDKKIEGTTFEVERDKVRCWA